MESLIQLLNKGINDYNTATQDYQTAEQQKYLMDLGGKRVRPLLALISCQMFGKDPEAALPAALAVEVFHNFSLVHDDIMDQAPMRRGKETVHQKWNPATAILTGDVMLVNAYELLLQLDNDVLKQSMELFSTTAIQVCDGQMLDMSFEDKAEVSINEYINMITLKTAVLLGCSLKLGAIVAQAPHTFANHLYHFGVKLGISFQLQDDILDVYAEGDAFGKQIGGDILANKKTFLLISAMEKATGEDKKLLDFWLTHPNPEPRDKVKAITELYNKLGIAAQAKNMMENYYNDAMDLLAAVEVNPEAKQPLYKLAQQLLNRNS
ncbi:MAG: polyprenyl synthetase family protein [Bacteroidota bacterium]|nr:polyprenyl synthetase family protein [Bacteroidota bacterium]